MTSRSASSGINPVREVTSIPEVTAGADLLVIAGGFEDRALNIIENARLRPTAHCIIVRYVNDVLNNKKLFQKYFDEARRHLPEKNIHVVPLRGTDLATFSLTLSAVLARLPREVRSAAIDVSGMPAYLVCCVLKLVRKHRSREPQTVLYTSAREYNPTRAEYDGLTKDGRDEVELVPRALALEMSDNLVPDGFSGYRSQAGKVCLVLFAGYEVHRAAGVLDAINPSLLLLLYGQPGNPDLDWRLDLSRRLHKKFERGRRTAAEVVSTLEVAESIQMLESYYDRLIDEYDLVIAPISSKMQSVAAYMFWERYGEVQLIFPIPIGYEPANCPQGVSTTYQLLLNPRRTLFKSEVGGALDVNSAEDA